MKLNYPLLALAIGAFGIGTTEFSPMGLLPVIAKGVDVSIPAAGMLISAYAVGVMVGAPLMTLLLSHRARRNALIFLMAIFTLGNVLSAISPDYTTLMLSRILTSLNHGAFFGLGSVVAASVVPKHKQASAVATMFMGLTIANIGGVPAATWLGETIGWRMSFMATAGLGVIAMVSLFFSLPKGGAGERPDVRSELAVLMRPQVLSALLTTVLGAGAMFTLYTYISPVLHTITHATPAFVTGMLVLIGIGFSIGNYFGGKFADRSVNGTLKGFLLLLMVIMLAIPFLARNELGAAISMVVWGAQLARRENLSLDTVKRMYSYFSRHEVDKKGKGFNSGEEGFPSKGRVMWEAWGGDSGYSWSRAIVERESKKFWKGTALDWSK